MKNNRMFNVKHSLECMLYALSLGPGDPELITLKALRIIKSVDKIYVPGRYAYNIVKRYRKPTLLEVPMGKGKDFMMKVADKIISEAKSHDIAFATIGDIHFFSTFKLLFEKAIESGIKVETIPGVASFSSIFSRLKIFVSKPFKVVTQDNFNDEIIIVLKVTRPRNLAEKLKDFGYKKFLLVEKAFMENERITENLPDKSDYFSILVGMK